MSSSSTDSRPNADTIITQASVHRQQNSTSLLCNGTSVLDDDDEAEEKLLAGASAYLGGLDPDGNNFETQSVRSEVLSGNIDEANLVASTPLNASFMDETPASSDEAAGPGPKFIDFFKYKIRNFKMAIGQAFSLTRMSGYIVDSPNEVSCFWVFFLLPR